MTRVASGGIFQPGDLLNNTYRIEKILGRGGTSEVYRARSEISGRVMAVKALRAEYASNEDFLVLMTREEDIRDVHHEAIVRYFDTQRMADGVIYLVMDYVDGPGLDRKLAEGGLPADALLVVGARVCEGLIAAHARNIVHRDLSPDNIILRNDDPAQAVIIDFGIAKDTNPGAETIVGNEFAGKYAYAAPEQLSGRTDARSDIYALGALLLATFRGKKPDMGRNPMEVVEKKARPLDVEGVPEPLRSLIARMSDPVPEKRFQSAADLLAAFRHPERPLAEAGAAAAPAAEDATVIAPAAAARKAAKVPVAGPENAIPPPGAASSGQPPAEPRRRGGLVPTLVLGLVVAAGAAGYFSGVFDGLSGPAYPPVDPFALTVEKQTGGALRAAGHVPGPDTETALRARAEETGGTAELTLASGAISEDWGPAVIELVTQAAPLEEFHLSVEDDRARLVGLAPDRDALAAVEASFADGFPGGLRGSLDLQLGPRFLTPAAVRPLLEAHADCGPLQLPGPPPIGYGLEDRIIVTGQFAEAASRDALRDAIADVAGNRPVRIEAEVLNPGLCRVGAVLPRVGSGGFEVRLGYGDRPGGNPSGVYRVGDNPVIDIALPDGVETGYLWVSVVDVKGVVFHLLPNVNRPDNSIASLRAQAPDGLIRVAYPLGDARAAGRLAFTVDGSVLGKSKVLVLHSDGPLFAGLRPTTESAEGYAAALIEAQTAAGFEVRALDSALLTTER